MVIDVVFTAEECDIARELLWYFGNAEAHTDRHAMCPWTASVFVAPTLLLQNDGQN